MSDEEKTDQEETIQDNQPKIEKHTEQKGKAKLFSLIETLGMFCLYAGVAILIITYFAKYGFTFTKLNREQIFDLLVWGARGGLIFALVIGLPIWLAREYGHKEH
jgi:hypothetical protein